MNVDALKEMLQNRLKFNQTLKDSALARGDMAAVSQLDEDSFTTQQTLNQINALMN